MNANNVRQLIVKRCPGALAASICVALAACASQRPPPPSDPPVIARELPRHPIVLLGEVHDNPQHHRLRFEALRIAVEEGYRPAVLMEQFDRERQSDIERARRERPRDAAHLIKLAAPQSARPGDAGWNWVHYQPFVQLALDHDLPLIAANASREDLARVSRDGPGALFSAAQLALLGLDKPIPADLQAAQEREIAAGHCNVLPAAALAPMARAQVARDAFMALKLAEHAPGGALLIAGNGHVRRDLGAPRWLPPGQVLSVGYLEEPALPSESAGRFDRTVVTTRTERPDPCEAFVKSRQRESTNDTR